MKKMKNFKKVAAMLLAVSMVMAGMAGCGKKETAETATRLKFFIQESPFPAGCAHAKQQHKHRQNSK